MPYRKFFQKLVILSLSFLAPVLGAADFGDESVPPLDATALKTQFEFHLSEALMVAEPLKWHTDEMKASNSMVFAKIDFETLTVEVRICERLADNIFKPGKLLKSFANVEVPLKVYDSAYEKLSVTVFLAAGREQKDGADFYKKLGQKIQDFKINRAKLVSVIRP